MSEVIKLHDIKEDAFVARAAVDQGEVVLVHNCSSHYTVAFVLPARSAGCPQVHVGVPFACDVYARVLQRFNYSASDLRAVAREAWAAYAAEVDRHTSYGE